MKIKFISFLMLIILFLGSFSLKKVITPKAASIDYKETFVLNYKLFSGNSRLLQSMTHPSNWMVRNPNSSLEKSTFELMRRGYKKIEWLFYELYNEKEASHVNGSKHWVERDSIFEKARNLSGLFQRLEKYILLQDFTNIFATTTQIDTVMFLLNQKVMASELTDYQILRQWSLMTYQQYLVDLTGYYRIDTEAIPREIYTFFHEGRLLFKKSHPELVPFFEKVTDYLKDKEYKNEAINRITFLTEYIEPLGQALNREAGKYQRITPSREQPIRADKPVFSADFIDASVFSNISNDLPTKSKMIELGQMLFFEPAFSGNNKRSCASCHKPQKAFSDGRITSQAFKFSKKLKRNSPSLLNTIYNQDFGHGGEKAALGEQIMFVINSHEEFNSNIGEVMQKLNSSPDYLAHFKTAFPNNPTISPVTIFMAMIAYMEQLKSFDSEFDRFIRGETEAIAEEVANGYQLFMGKAQCGSCHFAPTFSGLKPIHFQKNEYHTHGTPTTDKGNKDLAEQAFFKIPSIRNIPITEPLMHNGHFVETASAFEHIFTHQSETAFHPPALTSKEQSDIKAFIYSLKDLYTPDAEETTTLPTINSDLAPSNRRAGGMY